MSSLYPSNSGTSHPGTRSSTNYTHLYYGGYAPHAVNPRTIRSFTSGIISTSTSCLTGRELSSLEGSSKSWLLPKRAIVFTHFLNDSDSLSDLERYICYDGFMGPIWLNPFASVCAIHQFLRRVSLLHIGDQLSALEMRGLIDSVHRDAVYRDSTCMIPWWICLDIDANKHNNNLS